MILQLKKAGVKISMKRRRRSFIEGGKPPSPSSSSSSLSEYSTSSSSSSFTSSSSSSSSSSEDDGNGSRKRKRSHRRSHNKEKHISADSGDRHQPHNLPFPLPPNYRGGYSNSHAPMNFNLPSHALLPPSHDAFRNAGKSIRSIVRPTHKKITYYDDPAAPTFSGTPSSFPLNIHNFASSANLTSPSSIHKKPSLSNSNNYPNAYTNSNHNDLRADYNMYNNNLHYHNYNIPRHKSNSTTAYGGNNTKHPSSPSTTSQNDSGIIGSYHPQSLTAPNPIQNAALPFLKTNPTSEATYNLYSASANFSGQLTSYHETANQSVSTSASTTPIPASASVPSRNSNFNSNSSLPANNTTINPHHSKANSIYPDLENNPNLSIIKPEISNSISNPPNIAEPPLVTLDVKNSSSTSNTTHNLNSRSRANIQANELYTYYNTNQAPTPAATTFSTPNLHYDPSIQYAVIRNPHMRQIQSLYSTVPTGAPTRFSYLPLPTQASVYSNMAPAYPSYVVWRPAVPPSTTLPDNARTGNPTNLLHSYVAPLDSSQFTDSVSVSSNHDDSSNDDAYDDEDDSGSTSESEAYDFARLITSYKYINDPQARARLFSSPSPTPSSSQSPCPSPSPTPELSVSPTRPSSPLPESTSSEAHVRVSETEEIIGHSYRSPASSSTIDQDSVGVANNNNNNNSNSNSNNSNNDKNNSSNITINNINSTLTNDVATTSAASHPVFANPLVADLEQVYHYSLPLCFSIY